MGARKLRDWILRPLTAIDKIKARQDTIERMMKTRMLLNDLTGSLGMVRDLERLIARIGTVGGNARDMNAIAQSLEAVPAVRKLVAGQGDPLLESLAAEIIPMPEVADMVRRSIVDEPPISIKEGGIIREGYNKELDEFRSTANAGRNWLGPVSRLSRLGTTGYSDII
jgi:DNA mismatch repair protein MutS